MNQGRRKRGKVKNYTRGGAGYVSPIVKNSMAVLGKLPQNLKLETLEIMYKL